MPELILATTEEHALLIWNASQVEIDWTSLRQGEGAPPFAAGFLDLAMVGAVARDIGPAYQIIDGVPVIHHEGGMSKYPTIGRFLGIAQRTRTYSELAEGLHAAAADRKARTEPLLILDTPGGGVLGFEELARAVRETGAQVYADMATSAGTWAASAASRVTVARGGIMGSIGVIAIPVDVSARLEREGLKPHPVVSRGAEIKALGADGTVSDEYVAKIRTSLDATASRFHAAVRDGRNLTPEGLAQVITGAHWVGEENVRLGLADAVASDAREVIQTMATRRRSTTTTGGPTTMPDVPENEASEVDIATRLQALEDQLAQERQARVVAEQAHQADLARLQAVETEHTVDKLLTRCADAPPCMLEGRDLAGFLRAAVGGAWTITAADGKSVSAAEFVVDMVSAANGLVQLAGDDVEELAGEEAPEASRRQEDLEASGDEGDPEAKDEGLDSALDSVWEARHGSRTGGADHV